MRPAKAISVRTRGRARGTLRVFTETGSAPVAQIEFAPGAKWKDLSAKLDIPDGAHDLAFHYAGRGSFDRLEFTLP